MSSLETEDYFDIPDDRADRKSGEFKPVWTSAEAHLNPHNQQKVQFLVTNSRLSHAHPRDKIPSRVLKAMELESTRVRDGECEQIDSLDR